MFFSRFLKHAKCSHKYERLLFFLSSHIYFRRNALASYYKHFTRNWSNDDPHPSNELYRRFLAIDAGHYGLYYTVYNHDADQSVNLAPHVSHETVYEYLLRAIHDARFQYHECLQSGVEFMILKANRDIFTAVIGIKAASHEPGSRVSIRQKLSFHVQAKRAFQTCAKSSNVAKTSPAEEAIDFKHPIKKPVDASDFAEVEEPFEASFLATQSNFIRAAYNLHTPDALNAVYPLYQSLKRNNIAFPSIDMYNIVLSSISKRSLDSGISSEELESKLTTLLTVYQDILHLQIKPNHETFDIVLLNLFQASIATSHINSTSLYACEAARTKLLEFAQIGVDILISISDILQLNLNEILPQLLQVFQANPETISLDLITKLSPFWLMRNHEYSEQYYSQLLSFTKHFTRLGVYSGDSSKVEELISSIYDSYCNADIPGKNEFAVYAQMIDTFVSNSQTPAALEFLDRILCDYKNSLDKTSKPSKLQILSVISAYVLGIARSSHEDATNKAYELLRKFNAISYLPELEPLVYNQLIQGFYDIYYRERASGCQDNTLIIQDLYTKAWKLYEHVAIRRDFQETSWSSMACAGGRNTLHCRDLMLLMSLEFGDHESIFLIIKEILAKGHAIGNTMALTGLLQYLRNASDAFPESSTNGSQYFNVLWSVAELQSAHHTSSADLNRYLSEVIGYLMVPQSDDLIGRLLNSPMIRTAIDLFNLPSDPIYGLVLVSHYISNYSGPDILLRNKVLEFNAKLICQFEDEDNHHIVYEEDVRAFKGALINHLGDSLAHAAPNSLLVSPHLARAAKLCGFDHLIDEHETIDHTRNENFERDLTVLLNTNMQVGVSKFVEYFKQGYHFTAGTWEIVINYDFVKSVLDPSQSGLRPSQFIDRLWQQLIDIAVKTDLTKAMMDCQRDSVNIKIAKFLRNEGGGIPDSYRVFLVNEILSLSTQSPNIKLQSELCNGFFAKVYDGVSGSEVEKYFEYLNHKLQFAEIVEISRDRSPLIFGNETLTAYYFQALTAISSLGEEELELIAKINLAVVASPELARVLLAHFVGANDYAKILKAKDLVLRLDGESRASREEIAYADAVMLVRGLEVGVKMRETKSQKELNRLLLASDTKGISQLLDLNKRHMFKAFDENVFLQDIMTDMKSIAAICEGSESSILYKFENIMNLVERAGISMKPSNDLPRVILFLTALHANDLLDILMRKLSYQEVGITIKIFLVEFTVSTLAEKLRILQSIRSAFVALGNSLGIRRIDRLHL